MPTDEFFNPIKNTATPPVYRFFDGSNWKESTSGKRNDVRSPATGEIVGSLQVVTREEIDLVIDIARRSQRAWEETSLNKRVTIMHLAADWIRHYTEYLTALLVGEIGKTHDEAKSEIIRTADLIDYYADEVQSLRGVTVDSDNFPGYEKGKIALIERVAHGVVLAISPFNYPVNLTASKIAPALLMGNSVVCKPPTAGGISALHLIRIFEKAGVPPGVLTAVTGSGEEIGDMLIENNAFRAISFTGSSETGSAIAKKAGMIPLLFECGGNNPVLLFPDADMNLAAREIVKGAFSYSGQRCTGIKYILATEGVFETILPLIQSTMSEMVKMGDPRSPDTKLVGPLVSEKTAQTIENVILEAVQSGAKIIIGGKRHGAYIDPTILTDVTTSMKVVSTEIFGPVLSCIVVRDTAEAARIVNESHFGLQASIFTRDEGAGIVIAKLLNVGTVQINGSPQRGPDHFPFLGVKKSGLGVQGVRYSLEAMSRLRPIVINKPS